jgi:hypoxanthine phosphoribosyltransferase
MQQDIKRILISRDQIAQRIAEIAEQITLDFANETSGDITLVPILTGSIIFVADLIRLLPIKMLIRLISISSYPGSTTTSKVALIREELTNLPNSLENAHVLIIDDILDSGQTIDLVTSVLLTKNPASIKTCVLLRKDRPNTLNMPIDYVCFDIPDEFVVGYGLDYNDYYRNLPDIVTLHPQVLQADNA